MTTENLQFKAEIQQILDLMIHSVYSNKDIFLRELVANAADAIDKARFLSLTKPELTRDWEIRISADKDAHTLSISDNGIGMTKEELIENIGTIAHSGTKAFLEALKNPGENITGPELIGQFGVGFYSAFMAADKVCVETKKIEGNAKAWKWESDGKESFTVSESERQENGTTVTLHLKEDYLSYLEYWQISSVIKKYSDYIEHPIRMKHTVTKDGKEETEDSTLNSRKAIWLRNESEVTEEEYKTFYQHLSMDYGEPLKRILFSAEGTSEFRALLFIAGRMPFQFQFGERNKNGIHLYVRRVFITDECPGLLPDYLRFVYGVVDSSDLPLNISRETLQDNPQIAKIDKALTSRILSELGKMLRDDLEKYESFYREFSRLLKEGVHSDYRNQDKLKDLLLFESMNHPKGKLITLKEYVDAMPSTQKEIYYLCGDSRDAVENSPQLEMLRKQNFDVLFMLDPVDEFVFGESMKYADKAFHSVSKGNVKFDEAVQKELDEKTRKAGEDNKSLIDFLKKTLENKVKDVRFSSRLTESACCLVSDEFDPSANMQRMMKAFNKDTPEIKRILELNADNPLIEAMKKLHDKTPDSPELSEYAEMLYDQALVSEGSPLPDPVLFAKRTVKLMTQSLEQGLDGK